MDFGFSEEQDMWRDQVTRFMAEQCTIESIRQLDGAFASDHWSKSAERDWLGLIVPERFGGVGLK